VASTATATGGREVSEELVTELQQQGGKSSAWSVLSIRNVRKSYVDTQQNLYTAITDISVSIRRGDFYCLLGPSGCGKSTLLNLIAGFEDVTSGSIAFSTGNAAAEVPISGPGVDRAMIFQDVNDSLFPWLDTEENVAFGPKLHGISRAVYQPQLSAYLQMVGLDRHAHKFPFELSGGMRQRVQIARALIMEPQMLLMDEPFAALDAITKRLLQRELVRIWRETHKTVVYVTHDIVEALLLGTRVAVMTAGPAARIKQEVAIDLKSPRDPTNADFVELTKRLESLLDEEVKTSRGVEA
jgi:NitT/TauT family transport system ATP-binding protein